MIVHITSKESEVYHKADYRWLDVANEDVVSTQVRVSPCGAPWGVNSFEALVYMLGDERRPCNVCFKDGSPRSGRRPRR